MSYSWLRGDQIFIFGLVPSNQLLGRHIHPFRQNIFPQLRFVVKHQEIKREESEKIGINESRKNQIAPAGSWVKFPIVLHLNGFNFQYIFGCLIISRILRIFQLSVLFIENDISIKLGYRDLDSEQHASSKLQVFMQQSLQ